MVYQQTKINTILFVVGGEYTRREKKTTKATATARRKHQMFCLKKVKRIIYFNPGQTRIHMIIVFNVKEASE